MKRSNFHFALALVIGLCASSAIFAQTSATSIPVSDRFLISAKAGGVNYLEGSVSIIRASGTSGVLLKRDRVEIGDRVSTGQDGLVEILLNPGSFIRLGKNSSFEFGSTDLEDLQITLDSGSAIFEVFAGDEFRVSVSTPKGKLALVDTGVYRVDVSTDGTALLSVSKGKAEVGEGSTAIVKEGRTGTVGTDSVAIAKFDKGKLDDLGEWSKMRSKELTKIANSLQNRNLSQSLLNTHARGLWNIYDSFGLWIYDARFGGYCFLPFGNSWRSPYGNWYGNGIYWNNLPTVYNPVAPPRKVSSRLPRVDTGDPVSSGKVSSRERVRETYEPPPFTKVRRGGDTGDSGFGGGIVDKGSDFRTERSSPMSSPSYSPPPPPPAAPPVKVSSRDN